MIDFCPVQTFLFQKQPALPSKAPQKKSKKYIHSILYIKIIFWGARPGSASGCFKKVAIIPK
jgi:hypothetical protein